MRARAVICVGVACFVVWIAVSLPPGRCDDGYRRSRSNPAAIQRQGFGPPPWGESGAQAVKADAEVCCADVRRRQSSARLGAEKLMSGEHVRRAHGDGGRTTGATLCELGARTTTASAGLRACAVPVITCGPLRVTPLQRLPLPLPAGVVATFGRHRRDGHRLANSHEGERGKHTQLDANWASAAEARQEGLISAPRSRFIRRNFLGDGKDQAFIAGS
jgi:hypothetical protein